MQSKKAKSPTWHTEDSLARLRIRKTIDRMHERKQRLLYKQGVRNEYQSRKRASKNQEWVPDWRAIMEDLASNTMKIERWFETALHISIPEDAVAQLMYGVDDNLWDIANQYDCSVRINNERSYIEGAKRHSLWRYSSN